jgi:hypothetical protein
VVAPRSAGVALLENGTLCFVRENDLAAQTEDAFIRVDPAKRIDCTDRALGFAETAFAAALGAAGEPIEQLELGGNGKGCAERA